MRSHPKGTKIAVPPLMAHEVAALRVARPAEAAALDRAEAIYKDLGDRFNAAALNREPDRHILLASIKVSFSKLEALRSNATTLLRSL